jgi:hypothetical protein
MGGLRVKKFKLKNGYTLMIVRNSYLYLWKGTIYKKHYEKFTEYDFYGDTIRDLTSKIRGYFVRKSNPKILEVTHRISGDHDYRGEYLIPEEVSNAILGKLKK